VIGARGKRASGYAVVLDPDAPAWEHDTVTCGHCQRVIFTVPGTWSMSYLIYDAHLRRWVVEPGAWCRTCMSPVCVACHQIGTCTPWEKQMEQLEKSAHGRC